MKKYFLMLSTVLILVIGAAAHAATLDQVITKMNDYRSQNSNDPTVLGAMATAGGTATEGVVPLKPEQQQTIVNDLRSVNGSTVQPIVTKQFCYGSTDTANVKALQAFLAAKGYLNPSLITGNFYTKTSEALGAFQTQQGITGTGVGKCVGAQTLKKNTTGNAGRFLRLILDRSIECLLHSMCIS
jgi:peptidoglycan hydrolase-like protein with peptidoglycan-binding domain